MLSWLVEEVRRVNIHDIAREAGVSTATVSRVLNASSVVGEKTRLKVQAVIDAHSYTANALARGLLKNRTRTIGVLTVDILNPYYATVVHGIERAMSALGNSTLLCETGGSLLEKRRYIKTLLENRVDGLVFVGSVYREAEGAEEIVQAARSVPVVMINSAIAAENVYCLLCDDAAGMRLAADYMISAGRKRILLINTAETASARIKEEAFKAALSDRGLSSLLRSGIEIGRANIGELPRFIKESLGREDFDSIVACDDLFANIAVNTLHSLHVEIPASVWVLGFNNSYVCDHSFPRLSSIDSRMADLSTACAETLGAVLEGRGPAERLRYLAPSLVLRDSTG